MQQPMKTYRAYTMAEALAAVKRDLGADAVILSTRSFRRGGFFGLGRKTVVEVTASLAEERRRPARARPAAAGGRDGSADDARRRTNAPVEISTAAARRAYAAGGKRAASTAGDRSRTEAEAAPGAPGRAARGAATTNGPRLTPRASRLDLHEDLLAQLAARNANGGDAETRPASPRPAAEVTAPAARPAPGPNDPTPDDRAGTQTPPTKSPRPGSNGNPLVERKPERQPRPVAQRFILQSPDGASRPANPRPTSNGSDPAKSEAGATSRDGDPGATSAGPSSNGRGITPSSAPAEGPPRSTQSIAPARDAGGADPAASVASIARGGDAFDAAALREEMSAIREMVGRVLQRQSTSGSAAAGSMPPELFEVYLRLVEQEVAEDLVDSIVREVRDDLSPASLEDADAVRLAVETRLAAAIPVATTPVDEAKAGSGPLRLALIGPTGVGKTTTVAKLAAAFKLRHGRKVGLVTSDTYRIAAVDQLRTYANIIGLPLEVVLTPAEMERACHALRHCDVILIDTAGRSQRDEDRLAELRRFVDAARPHEVHLVLSSTASEKVMLQEAEAFADVRVDKLILTKLDEAVSFGPAVNVLRRTGNQVSFMTTGQEVPDHIEPGRSDRIASLILGGELHG